MSATGPRDPQPNAPSKRIARQRRTAAPPMASVVTLVGEEQVDQADDDAGDEHRLHVLAPTGRGNDRPVERINSLLDLRRVAVVDFVIVVARRFTHPYHATVGGIGEGRLDAHRGAAFHALAADHEGAVRVQVPVSYTHLRAHET